MEYAVRVNYDVLTSSGGPKGDESKVSTALPGDGPAFARPPAPPWRKERREVRQRPPRRPLDRDQVVEAALRILRAEGLDAVSMRRVAQDLGTGPASLYAHVSGKDELLELALEKVFAQIQVPEPDPAHWQEQIKQIARETRRVLRDYRDISLVSLGSIPTGANRLAIAERVLAIMTSAGVPRQLAAWAIDRLTLYIDADCYEGAVFAARLPDKANPRDYMERYLEQVRGYYQTLPADRFPVVTSMVDELMTGGDEKRFEFGLDLLVRGLESYISGIAEGAGD